MAEEKTYTFKSEQIEKELETFSQKGITEFTLQDEKILNHKGKLLKFLEAFQKKCPDVFLTLPLNPDVLDLDVCKLCSNLYCTLELPLKGISKNGTYLFDKKFYSRRAETLNNMGLVFGFDMDFAVTSGDSVKLFRDRLDFALSLYPNHIDFPQLENLFGKTLNPPKPSQTFSTQDISMMKELAYACETFYSYGRAVPWFLLALKPLKMNASKFFQDFGEWQKVNNCGLDSRWNAAKATHEEIEKMQLTFLKFKLEEKNKIQLFQALNDIVRLNGAYSRCFASEAEKIDLDLNYNPEDLMSGETLNLASFVDNVTMEKCRVRIFSDENGVDYKIIEG